MQTLAWTRDVNFNTTAVNEKQVSQTIYFSWAQYTHAPDTCPEGDDGDERRTQAQPRKLEQREEDFAIATGGCVWVAET